MSIDQIRALENTTHTLELEQARLGERISANTNDIAELKDGMKVVGDLREALGSIKKQTTITWAVLLIQTSSMIAFAWTILRSIVP